MASLSAKKKNPYRCKFMTGKGGSQTRETMLAWAKHFVEHLDADQGVGGHPFILFLDGSSSLHLAQIS